MKKYSEKELNEFREIILKKLEKAREDLKELVEDMKGNNNGTDDTAASFKIFESGLESAMREEQNELAARQFKFIQQLELALRRIHNKTYGICRITGELIPLERLRLVPHATTSVDGKKIDNSAKSEGRFPGWVARSLRGSDMDDDMN